MDQEWYGATGVKHDGLGLSIVDSTINTYEQQAPRRHSCSARNGSDPTGLSPLALRASVFGAGGQVEHTYKGIFAGSCLGGFGTGVDRSTKTWVLDS